MPALPRRGIRREHGANDCSPWASRAWISSRIQCVMGKAWARAFSSLALRFDSGGTGSRRFCRHVFGDKVKAQAAGQRRRLRQSHGNLVAEAIGLARTLADQRMALLVVPENLKSKRAHGQKSVGAGFREAHEQAKARHRGNAALEDRADAVLHEGRDVTVDGI